MFIYSPQEVVCLQLSTKTDGFGASWPVVQLKSLTTNTTVGLNQKAVCGKNIRKVKTFSTVYTTHMIKISKRKMLIKPLKPFVVINTIGRSDYKRLLSFTYR